MTRAQTEQLERFAEPLTVLFYVLMLVAFLSAVSGSPGSGLLLLILGSCAHVARVGAEGLAEKRDARGSRGSGTEDARAIRVSRTAARKPPAPARRSRRVPTPRP